MNLWARLWSKCTLPDDENACILWKGALSLKRLGRRSPVMHVGGRTVSVARIVCEWFHGPAFGREAGHTCPTGENALCVNPRHLQWMTRAENEQYKRSQQCDIYCS